MNKNKVFPGNIIAGIVSLLGIISALLAMINVDIGLFTDYGMWIYLLIDILYLVACILAGIGMLIGNRVMAGIGAFLAAAGELLKGGNAIYEFSDYFDDRIQTLIYVIGMLVGCAAFIMFGVMCLRSRWKKGSAAGVISVIMLVITIAAETIYAFRLYRDSIEMGDSAISFVLRWLIGYKTAVVFIFLMIGFVIYIFMAASKASAVAARQSGAAPAYSTPQPAPAYRPQTAAYDPAAFANPSANNAAYGAPSYSAPQPSAPAYGAPSYNAPQPSAPSYSAPQPSAPAAPAQSKTQAMDAREKDEILAKYKELLDEGVLTQDEFDAKRGQILSL